jgi:GMP synthase (glutamine-hydrolysing) A subunit
VAVADTQRPVLVVDFGAQYAQLIARRVRESRVFSEVIPHTMTVEEIADKQPLAVILSGGPSSVYAEGAPQLDARLFDLGIPVFGICYGFQAMAQALGGTVSETGTREYGRTELNIDGGVLHGGLPTIQPVWMSHGDAVTDAPEGFEVTGTTAGAPVAAFEDRARRLAGVQYHPEVLHSPHGQQVLSRFLHELAGIPAQWTPANIAESLIESVREQIGDGHAICGLSGGVDSAVAAALVQRAIGAPQSGKNLSEEPVFASATNHLIAGSQGVLLVNLRRIMLAVEPTLTETMKGAPFQASDLTGLFGDGLTPLVASGKFDGKLGSGRLLLPFDFEKAITLIGASMNGGQKVR